MKRAQLPMLALLALSASTAMAQTVKPPVAVPVREDLLKAVRVHAAVLRSEPLVMAGKAIRSGDRPLSSSAWGQEPADVSVMSGAVNSGGGPGCFR